MPHIWADRVQDTTVSSGTGMITVAGVPPLSFRTFSAVCATGDTFYYAIAHRNVDEWEVGFGTYGAANQITRTQVFASSNANALVNFSAGTKDIWLNIPAALQTKYFGENLLINGDFQINQRGFAGGALTAGTYGFDRWKAATGGANCSRSGFTLTLSGGELEQIVQPSLWGVTSFASTQFSVCVEAPSQPLTVTFGSVSATVPAGSGRQTVTLTTGAGDTGNLAFRIRRASGSGVTFARVKLEFGGQSTAWTPRDRVAELNLCWRYYAKSYAEATAPGTATNDNQRAVSATSANTTFTALTLFPMEMQAAPTITIFNPATGAAGTYREQAGGTDLTVSSVFGIGTKGFSGIIATTNHVIGVLHIFHFVANAEL